MKRRGILKLSDALLAATLVATPALAADLVFTSGALAPVTEAQKILIGYLTQDSVQLVTAREVGFFPTVRATLPPDLSPGLKMAVGAIQGTAQARDSMAAMLPVGLGAKGGEFNKVFLDTFQRVVLRGEPARDVLARQSEALQRIMTDANAPCWKPDPVSAGACQVK